MYRKRFMRFSKENLKAELHQRGTLSLSPLPLSLTLFLPKCIKLFYLRFNFCSLVIYFCVGYLIWRKKCTIKNTLNSFINVNRKKIQVKRLTVAINQNMLIEYFVCTKHSGIFYERIRKQSILRCLLIQMGK